MNNKLDKIRVMVDILALAIGFSVATGVFDWKVDSWFYVFLGGVYVFCIIRLLYLVHTK